MEDPPATVVRLADVICRVFVAVEASLPQAETKEQSALSVVRRFRLVPVARTEGDAAAYDRNGQEDVR